MAPDTGGGIDPHVLKAIAKAWSWRRKLESGAAATSQDMADAEGVSDRYVGRMLRLAYLAPTVLDKLLIRRVPPAVSVKEMAAASELPWARSEEHTSELQSLMRISYAVFCLKKKIDRTSRKVYSNNSTQQHTNNI